MKALTPVAESILPALLEPSADGRPWFASSLAKKLDKSHTAIGTALNRLEAAGLVEGQMESLDEAMDRAPRRYFTITDKGVRLVKELGERKRAEGNSLLALASGFTPKLA